jgi:hypothetical protein
MLKKYIEATYITDIFIKNKIMTRYEIRIKWLVLFSTGT